MTTFINVRKDFGAKGDGVTATDGQRIQKAISVALETTGDVEVRIDRGVYLTNRPIVVDARKAVADSLVIEGNFAVLVTAKETFDPLLTVNLVPALHTFRLSHLVVNGNGTAVPAARARTCVRVTGMSRDTHVVEQVVAIWGRVGFLIDGGAQGVLRSCRASLCTGLGWQVQRTQGLFFEDCAAVNCAFLPSDPPTVVGHGFWVESGSIATFDGIHAEGNTGVGLVVGGSGAKPEVPVPGGAVKTPVRVTGGHFENNGRDGIFLDHVTGVTIRNCRLVPSGAMMPGSRAVFTTSDSIADVHDLIVSVGNDNSWVDLPSTWPVLWNM